MKKIFFLVLISTALPLYAQGHLCAVGGGTENYRSWSDAPYRWMVEKAQNGPVLVMHYDRGSEWLENYFKSFGAESASSLVVRTKSAANDSAVYKKILAARMVFLRGGDQYKYYSNWKGTLVENALLQLFRRGDVIGGSSAGLAVLGGTDYVAAQRSALSSDCLRNPHHRDITLAGDFLPLAPGVLFDSHVTARARQGRLLAFVAHWNVTRNEDIIGLGVDEHTAVCMDPAGDIQVMGAGSVTVFHQNQDTKYHCEPGEPLYISNFTHHLLTSGFVFSTKKRRLVNPPASAVSATAPFPSVQTHAARISLASGETAGDCRNAIERFCTSGKEHIFLITGENGAGFKDLLLNITGSENFDHVKLSAGPITEEMLDRLDSGKKFIFAGFSTPESAVQKLHKNQLTGLIPAKLDRAGISMLWCGNVAGVTGTFYLKNPQQGEYALQDGKLEKGAGLDVLSLSLVMPSAFLYDDYSENRVGGLYWMAKHRPGVLCYFMDKGCEISITNDRLQTDSSVPVIIYDSRVTYTDSSTFKSRPSASPRQSVALYGGRLLCLPKGRSMDIPERTAAYMKPNGSRQSSPPGDYNLDIYPNPGSVFCFDLRRSPFAGPSKIEIFNIRGQKVRTIPVHSARLFWSGRDSRGRPLPAGIYIAQVRNNAARTVKKFCIVR